MEIIQTSIFIQHFPYFRRKELQYERQEEKWGCYFKQKELPVLTTQKWKVSPVCSCLMYFLNTDVMYVVLLLSGLDTSKVFSRQPKAIGMHSAIQMSKHAGIIWFILWSSYLIHSYN